MPGLGERPVRVLYVLNSAGGGATQGILELLAALPREKYLAYLVTPDRPNERQQLAFANLAEKHFHVPMTWWNRKTTLPLVWRWIVWFRGWLATLGHIRPLIKICQIIREHKIDIVYTDTVLILDGALAAKLCRIPHIWHIKEWVGQHGRVKFWFSDWLLVKVLNDLSAYVIVMTHFIGELFKAYDLGPRLQVIYDGVDPAFFEGDLDGQGLREKLGIKKEQIVVGMSASLASTWKQHDVFIEMAALLAPTYPDAVFVVFGAEPKKHRNPVYNRPWHYFRTLKVRVTDLGLDDQFVWAGFHSNIAQMMGALDILVHPCAQEPFGRVAIEAMAAGRPVVGPDRGGIAESVVHGKTGLLVSADNVEAFANAVAYLIKNPDLRKHMGMNARVHTTEHFSILQHVTSIEEIYYKLLQ